MKKLTNGCVNLVNRFLPDPFIFCVFLTIIVFIFAIPVTGATPLQLVNAWGTGVWNLLSFAMQMVLVLVLGNAFATAPLISKAIKAIARTAKTPFSAILIVTAISTICCFVNWGFGLVVGALLAKEVAKQLDGVDYRLIIAGAYSGFVVWHAGISGSIPLALNTKGETLASVTGGAVAADAPISTAETIFSPWNLLICLAILIVIPVFLAKIHPSPEETVKIDPALLKDDETEFPKGTTPAEKIENSIILNAIVGIAGVVYLVLYFAKAGLDGLNLNTVNFIFLILGIIFHMTPKRYVHAIAEATKGAAGIIIQFPFYAGIQALMVYKLTNPDGSAIEGAQSLAIVISNFFVSISNTVTFPVFTFLAAGVVNFFVPSGGGQWTVQGPIMMPAGLKLGVKPAVTGMSIAWGDAWTNMIQPFWALPALGIAGLSARDIMGFCVLTLLISGVIIAIGFILVGALGISAVAAAGEGAATLLGVFAV
ncbi:MAG: short-chain fatty acid transporter [Lachnospiraceae bacterium]|nr:short-chain fatty acid transporter [Lachnospiraceae bacterium]